MEYQRIAAAGFSSPAQYGCCALWSAGVLERRGWGVRGFVFGTLLGPETTGPWPAVLSFEGRGAGCGTCVSGFPAATFHALFWVCGVCGTGLLFENYIVDASIFYKKQFPRI